MPEPRPIRRSTASITLAHLYDAIEAGLGPVKRELGELRHEVRELSDEVNALASRRGRVRRWLRTNLSTAVVNSIAGFALAAAGAAATYLIPHL